MRRTLQLAKTAAGLLKEQSRNLFFNNNKKVTNIHHNLPPFVKIVEVGPRDGLQNEKKYVPADMKVEFINRLSETGLSVVEATSFVSPKWVPQMKDASEVYSKINKKEGVSYPVLVPNLKGLEQAMKVGVKEVAVFLAASNSFSQKNINCTVEESIKRYSDVISTALKNKIRVRGYVSCVLGCPYEGYVDPKNVAYVADALYQQGCYEVSLGDTIGIGSPGSTATMLETVLDKVPTSALAVHFHNTYGQALANIHAALEMGIAAVDSSVAGIGGCPYAPGSAGNVSTEDVAFMLQGLGIETNVNLDKLIDIGQYMTSYLDVPNNSRVAVATIAKRKQEQLDKQKQQQLLQQQPPCPSTVNSAVLQNASSIAALSQQASFNPSSFPQQQQTVLATTH